MAVKKIGISFVMMLALTACQEKKDYAYLMQHPTELTKAVQRCNAKTSMTSEEASQCAETKRAATDFMAIVSEQQMNPEKFGKRVLQAEYQMVEAKRQLQQLQKTPGTPQQIASATQAYQTKKQEVKTLLAVLSTQSPE